MSKFLTAFILFFQVSLFSGEILFDGTHLDFLIVPLEEEEEVAPVKPPELSELNALISGRVPGEVTFLFEDTLVIAYGGAGAPIYFYDASDANALSYGKLIFSLSDNYSYLNHVHRSEGFSGKKLLRLVKTIQKTQNVAKITLIDAAREEVCPLKHKFRCREEMSSFSVTSVFLHGKKYYESQGAVPDSGDPEEDRLYLSAADYLHRFPVWLFLSYCGTLRDLGAESCTEKYAHLIFECCDCVEVEPYEVTLSELFRRLYEKGKGDKEAHDLYHAFKRDVLHGSFLYARGDEVEGNLFAEGYDTVHPIFAMRLFAAARNVVMDFNEFSFVNE